MDTKTAIKVLAENQAEMTGLEKALYALVLDLQSRVEAIEKELEF